MQIQAYLQLLEQRRGASGRRGAARGGKLLVVITTEMLTTALAIAALILSVLATVFEVAFFIIQSRQANAMVRENAAFSERMAGMLGEIRGHAVATREELESQYRQLLNAALRSQGQVVEEAVESETSQTMQKLLEFVHKLESSIEGIANKNEFQRGIKDLKEDIGSLMERLPRVARRSVEPAAPDFISTTLQRMRGWQTSVAPQAVRRGTTVLLGLRNELYSWLRPHARDVRYNIECVVTTPSGAKAHAEGMLEAVEWLIFEYPDNFGPEAATREEGQYAVKWCSVSETLFGRETETVASATFMVASTLVASLASMGS